MHMHMHIFPYACTHTHMHTQTSHCFATVYTKAKQLKLVGKTFAVYQKYTKTAKVLYHGSFVVYSIAYPNIA